jgi:hypothetical protein
MTAFIKKFSYVSIKEKMINFNSATSFENSSLSLNNDNIKEANFICRKRNFIG